MGTVTIHCPRTGKCISTGMEANRAAFGSMPVFFGSAFCPSCRISHEWFARNAWVCDFGPANCDPNCERRKLQRQYNLFQQVAVTIQNAPAQEAAEENKRRQGYADAREIEPQADHLAVA